MVAHTSLMQLTALPQLTLVPGNTEVGPLTGFWIFEFISNITDGIPGAIFQKLTGTVVYRSALDSPVSMRRIAQLPTELEERLLVGRALTVAAPSRLDNLTVLVADRLTMSIASCYRTRPS